MNYNLEQIKQDVQSVMEYVTGGPITTVQLMEGWEKNKEPLAQEMGGLIYETQEELIVDKSKNELDVSYEDFLSGVHICFSFIDGGEFRDFLRAQGCQSFYDNRVSVAWPSKKIPVGMKLNKSFKFFIKDKPILEKWQTKHSMRVQRKSFSGKLRLSIHPLDYLSMSTTAHEWSSCHDLHDGHCAGPLSYMGDSSTIIAYVCSPEKEYHLSTFPDELKWNSKKWRVTLYVNKDKTLIMAGKAYPFKSDEMVANAIKELQKLLGGEWDDIVELKNRNETKEYMADIHEHAVHYNDCLLGNNFYGFVSKRKDVDNHDKIIVGSDYHCLYCGEDVVRQPNGFMCPSCGEYGECELCGAPIGIYEDDEYYIEGMDVCEQCYDDEAIVCNECGDVYHQDSDNIVYDDVLEEFFCKYCYEVVEAERESEEFDDDWFDI